MKNACNQILIIGTGGTGMSATAFALLADKYPLIVTATAKEKVAEIRISGMIHNWNNSSEEITVKIDEFIASGIKDVNVYLNSPGGDVFQAAEIANQIQRFTGAKKGYGGALVGSAATMLAVELDTFEMAENGQFMYHKPSAYLSGNEDEITSALKLLQNLSSQYKQMYADKTGIAVEDIEAKWSKGDVWLTAKEALEQKFITGVIKKTAITRDTKAMFEACGSPNIPKITNHKKPVNIMNQKLLAQTLGLPEDASEEQINALVLANKAAAEETAGLKADATAKATLETTAKVDTLINAAIVDKKINATQAESLKVLAKADFAACESYIKGLTALGKLSDAVTPGATGTTAKDFSALSDSEKQTLAQEDPEAFRASYNAYLEKK